MKMIEQTEINEKDLLRSVRVYENNPVLEFELFKDYYVVDWYSNASQSKLFSALKGLDCPMDTPAIVQSKKKYPRKTDAELKEIEVEILGIKDRVYFLSVEAEEYSVMWHKHKGKSKRVEFMSKKKNIDVLVDLLNKTSRKNMGDKIKPDLGKFLGDYKD